MRRLVRFEKIASDLGSCREAPQVVKASCSRGVASMESPDYEKVGETMVSKLNAVW